MSKLLWHVLIVFIIPFPIFSQNPCAEPHARALVMGGGGSKGAFQAGAAYHLVTHRGCDFTEISGTSVGALNGAILAQAQSEQTPANSLQTLQRQVDSMISMWSSIKSTKDVIKGRPMATLRFGVFGLESLKNFEPLHKMLEKNVVPERLADGRNLRVGTVSFHDGRYHEIVLNAEGKVHPQAIDHLFGSAILPMFGTMPRVPSEPNSQEAELVQFADGSLRHTTPVSSYFQVCEQVRNAERSDELCRPLDGSVAPAHARIEQIFIITTSPYVRGEQVRPVFDPKSYHGNTHQIRDGRKIMSRALDLLMDTMYRTDLDFMYYNNDLLRWRAEQTESVPSSRDFPIRSYNTTAGESGLAARPYTLGVVLPQKEDAEITAMLDFSPKRIAEQLYCGCVAADRMMQDQFGAESMAGSCREKFRPHASAETSSTPTWFSPDVCAAPATPNTDLATAPQPSKAAIAPSIGSHP